MINGVRIMKNYGKNIIVLGCIGILLTGVGGCNKIEEKKEKAITVIVEPSIQKEVKSVADYMMKTEDIQININVLPSQKDRRDSEIQKLQTQIMSGKGADVYLLDTSPDASDMKTELFANPYQIMQSGALAPLDAYMETDSYWDKNTTYNMKILTAGQIKEKQYIIPLSCYYYVLSGTDNIEKLTTNTLGEWLKQVKELDDPGLTSKFRASLYLTSGRWFQPATDYETHQVLFDKEKWKEFAEGYFSLEPGTGYDLETQYQIQPVRSYIGDEQSYLKVLPDLEGRKMASVMTYGAVGMSSNYKEEAYEFIMLFLNDKIKEYAEENNGSMTPVFISNEGIPVEQNEIRSNLSDRSEATISAIEKSFEEIDGAFFITDAEKNIISNIRQTVEWGIEPENGWNEYLSNVAEKAWQQYEMQVKE